nr:Unknown Function [uncultured bacterium]
MITASILAFGAFWNSLQITWFNSRISAARAGEAYLALKDMQYRLAEIEEGLRQIENNKGQGNLSQLDNKTIQELEENELKLKQEKRRLLANVGMILRERFKKISRITEAKQLEGELKDKSYSSARHWISQRMIPNKEQATQYVQRLEDARTTNILLIHLPFFGIVFDVNALGLWGGLTFTIILLVFRFSLWREYNNLRLTFREAKPDHLRFCYMSLAMQQVLTVPPSLTPGQTDLKPRGSVVQGLYFPPLLIQLLIIINDFMTSDVGGLFNFNLTQISTVVSMFFFGLIVFLTMRCLQLSRAIDKEWDAASQQVQEGLSKRVAYFRL